MKTYAIRYFKPLSVADLADLPEGATAASEASVVVALVIDGHNKFDAVARAVKSGKLDPDLVAIFDSSEYIEEET
jgi:hypothetical protein